MKPRVLACALLLLALLASGSAGIAFYCARGGACTDSPDALTWLRSEFALSEEALARLHALHQAYLPQCADHCARYEAALAQRARARTPEERAAAEAAITAADAACRSALETHFQTVAAALGEPAGTRYLELVHERLRTFDHRAPPTLAGEPAVDDAPHHGHRH